MGLHGVWWRIVVVCACMGYADAAAHPAESCAARVGQALSTRSVGHCVDVCVRSLLATRLFTAGMEGVWVCGQFAVCCAAE